MSERTGDIVVRPPGCVCTWEEGDSDCPVHPTCPECGLPTAPNNQCECPPQRLTVAEFSERLKAILDEPERCECPKCSGQLIAGYGIAGGGGIGPYVVCLGCGEIVLKAVEDGGEGECFNA